MSSINITEKDFADRLFEFIKDYFNIFNHRKKSGNETWFTPSWSPFIQACFIEYGKILKFSVGSSYTSGNLKKFWENNITSYDYKKPIDRGFDISWHDDTYEFILGLEHEETGKTSEKRLEYVFDELDKLRHYKGKNKILVTRPYFNTKQNYHAIEDEYKEKIKQKLNQITPSDEEKWIIIFIGPENRLINPEDTTKILFSCYCWENRNLKKFCEDKCIRIKMNENEQVEKL